MTFKWLISSTGLLTNLDESLLKQGWNQFILVKRFYFLFFEWLSNKLCYHEPFFQKLYWQLWTENILVPQTIKDKYMEMTFSTKKILVWIEIGSYLIYHVYVFLNRLLEKKTKVDTTFIYYLTSARFLSLIYLTHRLRSLQLCLKHAIIYIIKSSQQSVRWRNRLVCSVKSPLWVGTSFPKWCLLPLPS